MEGLYYLVYIIAIMVVIQWCATSDMAGPGGSGKGLLAMKDPQAKKKPERGYGRKRPPREFADAED